MNRVFGQRSRIWVMMRSICSRAPAAPSMFERRSFATNKCSPQKMYSGR
jgi:hypothetical protein